MVTINPLTGAYVGASNTLQRTASRIQNTIASLVSGNRITQAGQDVAGLAIVAQLQSQTGTLRQTASNITQAASVTTVASDAIGQQQTIVRRLQEIATQSNTGLLDDDLRESLNKEFQSGLKELSRISEGTQFNGQKLLDGSFSLTADQALSGDAESNTLEIENLSAESLLNNQDIDVLSQQNAQAALQALTNVQNTLSAVRADVDSFTQQLDYAGAAIESALFNQQAALSELNDTDFAEAATELSLLNLQRNASIALQAQTNKLPANVLDLIRGLTT